MENTIEILLFCGIKKLTATDIEIDKIPALIIKLIKYIQLIGKNTKFINLSTSNIKENNNEKPNVAINGIVIFPSTILNFEIFKNNNTSNVLL